jgi:hypothetical protein
MNISKNILACIFSMVPLSIAKISQSREQHKIDIVPPGFGHGAFCDARIVEGNTKKSGEIFNLEPQGNLSMKIDGKIIKLNAVSRQKIGKKREISTYKNDEFKLKIDSTDISTPAGLKNCSMVHDETVTISSNNWKKVMLLKVGCDPCG